MLIVTEGTRLKQIKNQSNKITDTVFDFQPYQPQAVHVTRENKIIVGVCDDSDTSLVLLFVMNHEGNQERVYGEDKTKNISFTAISRITDTSNGNIFLVDTTDITEFYGNVKVLGMDTIINTYSGNSVINTEFKPFTPISLATTPTDNVIIADIDSNVLHILNSSGELITYINTFEKGIDGPHSICLAMAGQFCILYIGTSTNIGSKDKSKLYKLSIVGI